MDARDRSPVISQPFLSFLLFYIKHISFIYIICFIIDTSLCCCCLFLFRQSIFFFFLLIRTGTLFFFFPVLLLLHMMRSSTFSFYLHELVLSLQPIIDSKLLHATERPTLFIFSKIGKTAERWKGNQRVCEVLHKKIKCSYTHSLYLLLLLKKVK